MEKKYRKTDFHNLSYAESYQYKKNNILLVTVLVVVGVEIVLLNFSLKSNGLIPRFTCFQYLVFSTQYICFVLLILRCALLCVCYYYYTVIIILFNIVVIIIIILFIILDFFSFFHSNCNFQCFYYCYFCRYRVYLLCFRAKYYNFFILLLLLSLLLFLSISILWLSLI